MQQTRLLTTALLPFLIREVDSRAVTWYTRDTRSTSDSTSNNATVSKVTSSSGTTLIVHGLLMTIAFALLYPLGAMAIRLLNFKGLLWLHAGLMTFSYVVVLAGSGFGVNIAREKDLMGSSHVGIGLFVVVGLILQPITGLLHHKIYKKRGSPSKATSIHVWWGRAIITLGIVCGGTGLQLADTPLNGKIVYGVVAGVTWLSWIATLVFVARNKAGAVGGSDVKLSPLNIRQQDERSQEHRQA